MPKKKEEVKKNDMVWLRVKVLQIDKEDHSYLVDNPTFRTPQWVAIKNTR